jgi:hypothetical protein
MTRCLCQLVAVISIFALTCQLLTAKSIIFLLMGISAGFFLIKRKWFGEGCDMNRELLSR